MSETVSADMSVVLVTPDCYETIRKTVACLTAQTVRDRLELVIVASSAKALQLDERDVRVFFSVVVVEVGEIRSIGSGNAAGVRHASAPIVALGEDHSFPDPQWAKALIEAHRAGWAVVGPEVHNANPHKLISRADFMLGYGPWMQPAHEGAMAHLPGHNSSYKRSLLLTYGTELDVVLEAESVLHWELQEKGHRLYLEPRAKVRHTNFATLRSWLPAQFHSSRLFASVRGRSWGPAKKLLYCCMAPFIPAVRLWRMRRYPGLRPAALIPLIIGLVTSALGEMLGYGLGAGDTRKKLVRFEFHRLRHAL